MTENKNIKTYAKVLSLDTDGFMVGFGCPKCSDGWIKTRYTHVGETEPPNVGDVIPVTIASITMEDGNVTTVVLDDGVTKPGYMPDIVERARQLEILSEKTKVLQKQYTVREKINDTTYRIESVDGGKPFIGLAGEEMEVDTIANEDDFQRIAEEHQLAEYTLLHHWWENGKYEHWDLFLNDGECMSHFVLETDPLKTTEIKGVQRNPYSDDFWLKGEELEVLEPGSPGNPSGENQCSVERLDKGQVAIYESGKQPDDSYLLRVEFFGKTLEGRWSFTSTVPQVWHALKETTKLTEEDQLPMGIQLSGDIMEFKETPEGLEVTGTALSFGVWNGFYWSPEVIAQSPLNDFDDMIIDVEHDNNKPVGGILEKRVEGPDVKVKFLVKDYETIEKIKNGTYKGLSIDATVFANPVRRMVTGVKSYKRLTVCEHPACKVCYFGA